MIQRIRQGRRALMTTFGILLAAAAGVMVGGALAAILVTTLWGPQPLWMLRRG